MAGKGSYVLLACSLLAVVFVLSYHHLGEREAEARSEKRCLEEELRALEENLSLLSERLENAASTLSVWEAERENLKAGDRYHLRDPLLKEAKELAGNSSELSQLLYLAKESGIRCAFVAVLVENPSSGEWGEYNLIGFNTVDEGMVYFEPGTGYRVFPEVGRPYRGYLPAPVVVRRVVVAW